MHVVATAGHVDHGKSTLVRALTGMEPDRWAEERRRGMTIDLGYAWTSLPSGETIALVDVPGHERFVPNMLAGVGPVPAVLLVVAADEGWRQQSEEHLGVVAALGVRHALLAVTRTDLADPAPATAEATARMSSAGLPPLDAVAVSGVTGDGLDALRTALDRLVAGLPAPDPTARVRLWVDRVFTVRGSGTVVTGTLGAGTLREGDRLEVGPGGRAVTVRALQSLGRPVAEARPVSRVAVNLRGVDVPELARGDALVTPAAWRATRELDVRLAHTDRPLAGDLVLHVGSAAVPARCRPLAAGAARLRLAHALPLTRGDRAVLREPSSARVAGLVVLDVDPPPLGRRGAAAARGSALAARWSHDPTTELAADLTAELARRGSATTVELAALGLLNAGASGRLPLALPAGVRVVGDRLVDPGVWSTWRDALVRAVREQGAATPRDPAVPLPALRERLGVPDAATLAALLEDLPEVTVAAGRARLVGAREQFPPQVAAALAAVRHTLVADPFAAPERPVLEAGGLTPAVLAAAASSGLLLRVAPDVVLLPGADDEAVRRLAELPQPFTVSQARAALGTSRRVAVPLLEHLDHERRTVRRPDGTRTVLR